MSEKKNILQEAIADAKSLKEAARENASRVLMEQFKDNIKEYVDSALNEEEDENYYEESTQMEEDADMQETDELQEMDDLEVDELDDEEGEDDDLDLGSAFDDEDDDLEEGLSEADLEEALASALQEVDHGDLGEMEYVEPDSHADSRGLDDFDTKERGWEEKDVPSKKDWTVKESKYKKKIAKLVKENILYKKANGKLQEAVGELRLFNHKVLATSKLLQREGLSNRVKKQIVESLDNAASLGEVNSTFATWKTALGVMSEQVKSSPKKQKASLSEAVLGSGARKTERGVSQVDDDHLLGESRDPYNVSRMQSLAGIIKE